MITIVIFIIFMPVTIWAVIYLTPAVNKMFSYIWEDPSNKQRQIIANRIKELHVDGNVPEETAVMLAGQELNVDEQQILDELGAMRPSDLRGIVTGNKSWFKMIMDNMGRSLQSGTSRGRRRR